MENKKVSKEGWKIFKGKDLGKFLDNYKTIPFGSS